MKNLKTKLALAFTFIACVLCAQQQTPATNTPDSLLTKQKTRVKEYGIGFTGLNSYSLQYRWGNPKVLYRINANVSASGLSGSNDNSNENDYTTTYNIQSTNTQTKKPLTLSAGAGFSVLTLKQINPKFGFMLGGTAGLTYASTSSTSTTAISSPIFNNSNYDWQTETTTKKIDGETLQGYVGFVLGVYYKINPFFIIYAEIAPNVYYGATDTHNTTTGITTPLNPSRTETTSFMNAKHYGISGLTNSGAMITLVYRVTKIKSKK